MLRITWERSASANRLKAEGEIAGPESRVFWVECRKGLAGVPRFEIDLGGVTYIENADADGLRGLALKGVELINCTGFVWALLNHQDCKPDNVILLTSGTPRKRRRKPAQEIY